MNEHLLRELTVRLLTPYHPGMSSPRNVELFVGALPPQLPFPLPLPEGVQVIGSLVRGHTPGVEIVLDASQAPADIFDFYATHLAASGWTSKPTHHPRGGFTHGGDSVLWCRGKRGPAMHIEAMSRPNAPTDVRLHLMTDSRHSPCAHGDPRDPFALLPTLVPLPGAHQQAGGGGGGSDAMYSTAILETDTDLPSVVAHYHQQLEAAGWTMSDAGGDEPVRWSTWTVQELDGQLWQGLFFVLKFRGTNQHMLQVHLRWAEGTDSPMPSAWTMRVI